MVETIITIVVVLLATAFVALIPVAIAIEIHKARVESRLLNEIDARPPLDDDEFCRRYYPDRSSLWDVAIKARQMVATQLDPKLHKICPADNLVDLIGDFDVAELVYELENLCNVKVPHHRYNQLDGTFDSLVRCVAECRNKSN